MDIWRWIPSFQKKMWWKIDIKIWQVHSVHVRTWHRKTCSAMSMTLRKSAVTISRLGQVRDMSDYSICIPNSGYLRMHKRTRTPISLSPCFRCCLPSDEISTYQYRGKPLPMTPANIYLIAQVGLEKTRWFGRVAPRHDYCTRRKRHNHNGHLMQQKCSVERTWKDSR